MKNSSPPSLLRLQTCFSVARSISIAYTCTYKICSDARLNFLLTHHPTRHLRFAIRVFCTPKPDADLCMRVDLPLDKKTVENQDWATGPTGRRAAGPPGRGPAFSKTPQIRPTPPLPSSSLRNGSFYAT